MRYVFLLFLVLPFVAQAYVTWRTCQLIPLPSWGKVLVGAALVCCLLLFFLSLSPLEDRLPLSLASAVYNVGCSWFIILLYLLMLWLLLDAMRLCGLVPASWLRDNAWGTVCIVGLLVVIFGLAARHYNNKVRVELLLQRPVVQPAAVDPVGAQASDSIASAVASAADSLAQVRSSGLRIVMSSDWHLGYHNRRSELARWIDLINAEQPDLILIAGDIVDHQLRPLLEEDMAAEFRRLNAPVYACLGNHEYISGERGAERFFREAGICLLRDSVAHFRDVDIIGRDDRSNRRRRSVAELMRDARPGAYTILLDHQPYHLEEAEAAGVDFELAGHTHHGQVWPGNWITDALYECAFGPHRRGATRYYVSSGLGIWGARFRIATQSEYIVATLR